METYKISNLGAKTPQPEQAKLIRAVEAVRGVKTATLQPESGELTVEAREQQTVKRAAVSSAAAQVGFTVVTTW